MKSNSQTALSKVNANETKTNKIIGNAENEKMVAGYCEFAYKH